MAAKPFCPVRLRTLWLCPAINRGNLSSREKLRNLKETNSNLVCFVKIQVRVGEALFSFLRDRQPLVDQLQGGVETLRLSLELSEQPVYTGCEVSIAVLKKFGHRAAQTRAPSSAP